MDEPKWERRDISRRHPQRPPRLSPGRRYDDAMNRTTITKKFVVIVAALIEVLYLVAQALLFGGNGCL